MPAVIFPSFAPLSRGLVSKPDAMLLFYYLSDDLPGGSCAYGQAFEELATAGRGLDRLHGASERR